MAAALTEPTSSLSEVPGCTRVKNSSHKQLSVRLLLLAISRIRPVITERVASVNLPQYLSTALSAMTGLIRDIAVAVLAFSSGQAEHHLLITVGTRAPYMRRGRLHTTRRWATALHAWSATVIECYTCAPDPWPCVSLERPCDWSRPA
jgi:hypothetical protein